VAILLIYGTAHVLLAGNTEAREEEYMANRSIRGLKRSSGFRSTKSSDLKFRVLLPEGGARVLFYRDAYGQIKEAMM
jgi:hypothetical protein